MRCACALLGASAWLPAAASAAGSSDPTAAGPVTPAPPVLDDLMGRGDGAAAPELPIGLGALPGARETAAYAAGRVAVGVVFLESDGSMMTSTRGLVARGSDYPGQDRRQLVLAKIQNALDWWNARSPDGSLELFLPAAGSYGAPQTVRTGYEPIRMDVEIGWKGRQVLSDAAWRWEAMGSLGFAHDAADDTPVPRDALRRPAAQAERRRLGVRRLRGRQPAGRRTACSATAWSPTRPTSSARTACSPTTTTATPSPTSTPCWRTRWATCSARWTSTRRPSPGYPSTGDLRSGYLGVRNGNAVSGGTTDLPCIMRGSNGTLNAFASGDLCRWTVGQTGLRDSDADTRPDVVDTRPAFSTGLESTSETTGAVTLRGAVTERPRKRGRISTGVYFRHDLSIKVPHAAQYRVDGGAWQPLTATDGAFGEPSEGWTLTTEPLTAGHHVLDLEATTGETAGRTRDLWAGPTPVTLELATNAAFTKTAVTVAAGSAVRLYVRSTGTTRHRLCPCRAWRRVRLVRLADGKSVMDHAVTTGENGVWTGTLKPARTRVYEVRFAGAGQFLGPATSRRVTITVK